MSATQPGNASAVCDLVGAAVGAADTGRAATVEGIDWLVNRGEFWLMAAWADTGNDDLLATLAGLQRPLTGRFLVLGRDLYRLDQAELIQLRRHVGFVFGDGGRLFNDLTVAENIALAAAYHTNRSLTDVLPEMKELVACMELTPFADLLPAQVDRSWRQRAALARALAMKPELLLLANPLAGFDRRHIHWWREFLTSLNAGHPWLGNRPLTLIVATEEFHPWAGQATQFAVIRDRRLLTYRSEQEFASRNERLLREWQGGGAVPHLPQPGGGELPS